MAFTFTTVADCSSHGPHHAAHLLKGHLWVWHGGVRLGKGGLRKSRITCRVDKGVAPGSPLSNTGGTSWSAPGNMLGLSDFFPLPGFPSNTDQVKFPDSSKLSLCQGQKKNAWLLRKPSAKLEKCTFQDVSPFPPLLPLCPS